jgi:hypothetical protein
MGHRAAVVIGVWVLGVEVDPGIDREIQAPGRIEIGVGHVGREGPVVHPGVVDGADLQGSCFATYYREFLLFKRDPLAGRMYRALLEEDPFEISTWLHQRQHVSAVNIAAELDGVDASDVLDLDEFFDAEIARKISAAMWKRAS